MVGCLSDLTMEGPSRQTLGTVWKLVEDVINAILFLMLGLFVLKNAESTPALQKTKQRGLRRFAALVA